MSKIVLAPVEIWRDWYGAELANNDHWEGAPVTGRITSPFGVFRPRYGTYHSGIDLASPLGSPIIAPEGGEVVYSHGGPGGFFDANRSLGVFLILRHVNGWETLYAHMEQNSIVHLVGERVERGEPLGKIGVTGNTTGPHVHFMVADAPRSMSSGNPHLRNPEAYLRKTVPLPEGSTSPTAGRVAEDIGVRAITGLNNIQIEGQPVEYRRGFEWAVYRVSLLHGRVTDDDG